MIHNYTAIHTFIKVLLYFLSRKCALYFSRTVLKLAMIEIICQMKTKNDLQNY